MSVPVPERSREALEGIAGVLAAAAADGKRILVLPHVRADGDAVGSSLALSSVLTRLGARAEAVVSEQLDGTLNTLPGSENLLICTTDRICRDIGTPDMAVMLDCHETHRLGERADLYEQAPVQVIIDHHISNLEPEPLVHVDSTAAAVGQIIFHLVRTLEKKTGRTLMNRPTAQCLMGAILTDTGGFRFSNTDRETFAVASELMGCGAEISELSYTLLESMTEAKYRLIGAACSRTALFAEGKIGILTIPQELLAEVGAEDGETNGLANMIRSIHTVIVALVVREGDGNVLRVNVRSKEPFDASAFARSFGGGGHVRAAGFDLPHKDLAEAVPLLVQRAKEYLETT